MELLMRRRAPETMPCPFRRVPAPVTATNEPGLPLCSQTGRHGHGTRSDRPRQSDGNLAGCYRPEHPVIGYDRLTRRAARPCQATSSYGHGWWMDGTPGHVQQPQLPALQARGHWFDPQLRPPVSACQSHAVMLIPFVCITNGSQSAIFDFDVRSRAESASLVLSRSVPAVLRGDPVRYRK